MEGGGRGGESYGETRQGNLTGDAEEKGRGPDRRKRGAGEAGGGRGPQGRSPQGAERRRPARRAPGHMAPGFLKARER